MSAANTENPSVWLFGKVNSKLSSTKLPTKCCVLKAFLHNLSITKNVAESARNIATQVSNIWNDNGIPCIRLQNVALKLKVLHKKYNLLKRNKKRTTKNQKLKVRQFETSISKLFDIARADVESSTSTATKRFLDDQRNKRVLKLQFLSNGKVMKPALCHKKKQLHHSSDSSDENGSSDDYDFEPLVKRKKVSPSDPGSSVVNKIVNGPKVTAAIDRVGISSEGFRLVMGSIACELNADPSQTKLSRSTIKRKRKRNRFTVASNIKKNFLLQSHTKKFIVHWDGKLLPDCMNVDNGLKKIKVDRIAIAVSGNGMNKMLGVPKIVKGSGIEMARVVNDELEKWEVAEAVVGMCYDTTSSNTGKCNGACVALETRLNTELIRFPCRHHIHEIILAGVFEDVFGTSNGPNIQIFINFREMWNTIDRKSSFDELPEYNFNTPQKKRWRCETIECLQAVIADDSSYIPRNDYRELIDLTLIILGVKNPTYVLKTPGAMHHARWMCKIIYCFKMYLLRHQLQISNKFDDDLEEFCLFCSLIYVKQWVTCPLLADATVNDLEFYKNLLSYSGVNRTIARSAINKFNGHLSYLTPELAVFALFSDKVTISEKRDMIDKMHKCNGNWRGWQFPRFSQLHSKTVCDLITSRSLFPLHKINSSTFAFMLHNDPTAWITNPEYQQVQVFESFSDFFVSSIQIIFHFFNVFCPFILAAKPLRN